MISDARGGNVSPGIYTEERDVTYAVKSLGETKLGLVGETLKGPADQIISITTWDEFVDYFGGTSTEKYKGNGYPKYELPYIAKEYLKESKQLEVVRVLGLSGYKGSSAWTVNVKVDGISYPLVVLRSKGDYNGNAGSAAPCEKSSKEMFREYVTGIEIAPYSGFVYGANCSISSEVVTFPIDGVIAMGDDGVKFAAMSATTESGETTYTDLGLGKFALIISAIDYTTKDASGNNPTVKYTYNVSLNEDDRDYIYNVFSIDPLAAGAPVFIESVFDKAWANLIQNTDSGKTFEFVSGVTGYTNGFLEPFRAAETPWVVSEAKGASDKAIELKKLFKFYTISDGNAANYQVKVSIENIRPDDGLFTVVVRDFYDTDANPVILEKYSNLTMVEGESNYIGLKIGTYDGDYEAKSKYIVVRMADSEGIESCIPCGFLGYPVPTYGANSGISLAYNTIFDDSVRAKKQYFGLNGDILDVDILNYKGADAYATDLGDAKPELLTNGFHLDSIMDRNTYCSEFDESGNCVSSVTICPETCVITVDGESGYTFSTVAANQGEGAIPRILNEDYMENTIYADKNLRKFTLYPYGGFDGWDIYRDQRTNRDDYKATKYGVNYSGCPFTKANDTLGDTNAGVILHLPANAITTDYYAYLAGMKQFQNPQDCKINVFATPGINWYDHALLTDDVIDLIESVDDGRGGDAIYVADAPQYDENGNDYTSEDVVSFLEEKEYNTSYACTYFPWAKYWDASDKKNINLPVTPDVVRNMAFIDNKKFPWFAPAGDYAGKVNCVRPYFKTMLEDENVLYSNGINPVKHFAADKMVELWGQKTLYKKDSPLNRINTRRLMIRIKELVNTAAKSLIFDQYDNTLEKQFKSIVKPILDYVRENRGISDYRIVTECTEETRDQHILPAKILVKPIHALEYISISFTIYPESVSFDENL